VAGPWGGSVADPLGRAPTTRSGRPDSRPAPFAAGRASTVQRAGGYPGSGGAPLHEARGLDAVVDAQARIDLAHVELHGVR